MYAASGILILCRWPSCALAKGRLVSIKELYCDARPTKSQDKAYMFRNFRFLIRNSLRFIFQ